MGQLTGIGSVAGPIKLDLDNASGDAFSRLRTSAPFTLFDSKQTYDNDPLLWDESLETGAGISSSHDVNEAATRITSTLDTAGLFTRQTFMRFSYQPGKSQMITMTGNIRLSGGGAGVQARIGQFDDSNGVFFENDEGTMKVVIRSKYSGSVVNTKIDQASWNLDTVDGLGASGKTADWTKSNIFIIDYQWLGVGRVRFGLDLDGVIVYVHEFLNASVLDGVYMSTPNLPLRYQLETQATSAASSIFSNCTAIIAEGGSEENGQLHSASTGSTHVDANVAGTLYAVLGIQLKSSALGVVVKLVRKSLAALTNDSFEWVILLNPTVADTFSFSSVEASSAVEYATGATANTVTGGTAIDRGYATSSDSSTEDKENAIYLGSAIDGTRDQIVLCARPLSANLDIVGSLTWREIH